jgi:A/G-specific adenine glycosylase
VSPQAFVARILKWFDAHGRKDLPWQQNPTPYRIWVSEIMLQQTQVATVIPYYQTFVRRFPEVVSLAEAALDEVLHLWSGLGYYARGRNLHAAARIICEHHAGRFPEELDAVAALPGIGRSTAGAILALALGQPHPILDGNVKRVLARFHVVEGWPGHGPVVRQLWALAERFTPVVRVAEYTQAIMDLGATVCTRTRPACGVCPLRSHCLAHREGCETRYPMPRPHRALPVKTTRMLLLCNAAGAVLLQRRPPAGVWGGLWSLPECSVEENVIRFSHERLGCEVRALCHWPTLRHTFTHFHLDILPVSGRVVDMCGVMEGEEAVWYNTKNPDRRGLAAPVKRLLNQLNGKFRGSAR